MTMFKIFNGLIILLRGIFKRRRRLSIRPPYRTAAYRWESGLLAEEQALEDKIKLKIAEFLAKPKPKHVALANHGPFNMQENKCLGCDRSLETLHSTKLMPTCNL